jgi:hypothetical protein
MNLKIKNMKKTIILLVSISFMLQSCYSYKTIDIKQTSLITVGKIYKIKQNGNYLKGKLISSNDTLLKIKVGDSVKPIAITEIEEIRKKKFSVGKTVGLSSAITVGTIVTVVAVFALTYSGPSTGSVQSPN